MNDEFLICHNFLIQDVLGNIDNEFLVWDRLRATADAQSVRLESQHLIPNMVRIDLQASASHYHSKVGFVMPMYLGSLAIENVLPVRVEAAHDLFMQLKKAVTFIHCAGLIHAGINILLYC